MAIMDFNLLDMAHILQIAREVRCSLPDTTCYMYVENQPFVGCHREPVVVYIYIDPEELDATIKIYRLLYDYDSPYDRDRFTEKFSEEKIDIREMGKFDPVSYVREITREKGLYTRLLFIEYVLCI